MYLLIYYIEYNNKSKIDYQEFDSEDSMNLFIRLHKEDKEFKFNVIHKYEIKRKLF